MKPGPPPKPTVLKKLAGNPGCRPLNEYEPQPRQPTRLPRVPRHLNKEGKREWRRIVRELRGIGLYTVVDRAALAMYCQAWGRWVEAERMLAETGLVDKTTHGNVIQNPYLGIANRAWEQLRKMLPEFGLTPASRSRIEVKPGQESKSLADQLFEAARAKLEG